MAIVTSDNPLLARVLETHLKNTNIEMIDHGKHLRIKGSEAQLTYPFRLGALSDIIKKNEIKSNIKIQKFSFRPHDQIWRKDGQDDIILTEKERDLILALYEAPDHERDKSFLLETVWGYASNVETHTLETHIYRLRRKIEPVPEKPGLIVTTETGYRLQP